MLLETLDWFFIILFFVVSLAIGIITSRKAGASAAEFFLSGRNMPWWLLGVSMVATTFSADTPNLVTDIVRQDGVAGNWQWWAFLLTGMLTVFVYAKLWRRSKVLTDLVFYELRYSGKAAAMLRGFRALYLGVFFNIMIMATVCLAAIKIGGTLLGLSPAQTLIISSVITVLYSALGGLKGVLITDFFQFIMAMIGTVWAAMVIVNLPEVGGIDALLAHEMVADKLSIIPEFDNMQTAVGIFILPLAVQWWSVWYPGAEPGGGGYIAQRMLSAKDEKNAVGATLFFNIAHYALRPWPWILIALASIVVFPSLADIQARFPNVDPSFVKHDMAYPAMLTYLPHGLLGLVIASLAAAFMSTISTHLNWGSSYVVHDYYARFINPNATDKQLVNVGRISTVLLMVFAAGLALMLSNAIQAFRILLTIGAGTGLIFILRWFWWRINAYTEITGMIVSFVIALYFELAHEALGFAPIPGHFKMLLGVGITTVAWIIATLVTKPDEADHLVKFYEKIRPAGPGWKSIAAKAKPTHQSGDNLSLGIVCMVIGCVAVYAALFAVGYWIYGKLTVAITLLLVAVAGMYALFKLWGKVNQKI